MKKGISEDFATTGWKINHWFGLMDSLMPARRGMVNRTSFYSPRYLLEDPFTMTQVNLQRKKLRLCRS